MICSSCRSSWGCQNSVRPAEEVCYRFAFHVGHDRAVVPVAESGWGGGVHGGGPAVVAAR